MPETKALHFIPVDWSAPTADPQDRLLGRIVTYAASPQEVKDADVIIFGIPFDGAVLGRAGAASGPTAIRAAARLMKACTISGGELRQRVFDLGDVRAPADDVTEAHTEAEQAARVARQLIDGRRHNRRVVALGGDHSLTFPCALPYLEEWGDGLGVINLDAHFDVREAPPNTPFNSGTSFGRLLEKGLKHYAVLGARDFQNSPAYLKRVRDAHGTIVTAAEIHAQGVRKAVRKALAAMPKDAALYLSVDIDVADASVAPAVSAPTPGGLLSHQLLELVRAFGSDPRLVACDIMELAPPLEVHGGDLTARLAAACLAEMIGTTRS